MFPVSFYTLSPKRRIRYFHPHSLVTRRLKIKLRASPAPKRDWLIGAIKILSPLPINKRFLLHALFRRKKKGCVVRKMNEYPHIGHCKNCSFNNPRHNNRFFFGGLCWRIWMQILYHSDKYQNDRTYHQQNKKLFWNRALRRHLTLMHDRLLSLSSERCPISLVLAPEAY